MAHLAQQIEQNKPHQNQAASASKKVAVSRARIDMRIDYEVKKMAERASTTLGYASLTEYLTSLIRDHAPKVLEHEAAIQLTNAQFDHFMQVCNEVEIAPSDKLLEAAKSLDAEGF